jgi:hypothetical protein
MQIMGALLGKDQPRAALPYGERALRLVATGKLPADAAAEIRLKFAYALVLTHGDRARVRELLALARPYYVQSQDTDVLEWIEEKFRGIG